MKRIIIYISVILNLAVISTARAQIDPHFSQYYANPLWLNPALTGVIDGDSRLNANAKNQWTGIPGGYKTAALSADFRASERMGLGINILNQAAGTAGYNYFTAYASYGYGIPVSADGLSELHFGVQAGLINRSFDPGKLQFDDQFNSTIGFDPTAPSFENFSTTSATVFDASAGIFYFDGNPFNDTKFFGGVSVSHLTSPQDPFTAGTFTSKLPMRFTVHGGVRFKAGFNFYMTPHLLYIQQQSNTVKALGLYTEMKFEDNNSLILGGMLRAGDAVVGDVGFRVKGMVVGLSYDVNTSALHTATNSQGGLELSVSYVFKHHVNPAIDIPTL